jgi:hypothetical protein
MFHVPESDLIVGPIQHLAPERGNAGTLKDVLKKEVHASLRAVRRFTDAPIEFQFRETETIPSSWIHGDTTRRIWFLFHLIDHDEPRRSNPAHERPGCEYSETGG